MSNTTYLKGTCPYCSVRYVSFSLLYEYKHPAINQEPPPYIWALVKCGHCHSAVMAAYDHYYQSGAAYHRSGEPTLFPAGPRAPEHLPARVEELYLEALASQPTGAGMLFRKTLEIGLKIKYPDDRANLSRRIQNAADAGEITEHLARSATHIRIIGNAAAHEEEPPTHEEIRELKEFAYLFLMYLFTLPEMLRRSTLNRDNLGST